MKDKKLHNIKDSGFKTPDGYFDSFDSRMMDKLKDESNLVEVSDPGFKVPVGYFDSVDNAILNAVKKDNNADNTPIFALNSRKTLFYTIGIAASLVLLLAIMLNRTTEDPISVDMVETYLESQDLDSYELAELLAEAEVLNEDFELIETTYEEDNLETYLLENADIESILE